MLLGNILSAYICSTKDEDILNNSTSGGFITTTIKYLLEHNIYDCAFLVKNHNYDEQVFSEKVDNIKELKITSKSRYLPVSQYKTAKYILDNPKDKVIIVGTPCHILALKKIIDFKKLNKDNYLFIGLFCDKTMSYNVIEYFKNHPKVKKEIKNFYFRTKDGSKWPGDVGITYSDNTKMLLSSKERMSVKEYFCLERCWYCSDKLNSLADISVGDNYTEKKLPYNGSNSIIIRTDLGQKVWNEVSNLFYYELSDTEELVKSQHLKNKYINLKNLKLKESNNIIYNYINDVETSKQDIKAYKKLKKKIQLGSSQKNKLIYRYTHYNSKELMRKLVKKIKGYV